MESSSGAPYLLPTARWGTRMGAAPILDALLQDGPPRPQDLTSPWALRSAALAAAAQDAFTREITPVPLPKGGDHRVDELPSGHGLEADGAAVLLLSAQIPPGGPHPLARIRGAATGPNAAAALTRALEQARLPLEAMDRLELDEGCPGLPQALLEALPAMDEARVNRRGGALALGLPLGAGGARLLVTLAHQMRDHDCHYGLAAAQAGTGPGLAMILERP
jgi:acetyl-CoA C-acetyltransferase